MNCWVDWINWVYRCSSAVGRVGGGQTVSLDDGCIYTDIVQHELMHSVGFWHEQSRYDRDDYVIIHWDNIQPGKEHNFDKYSYDQVLLTGNLYDYSNNMLITMFRVSRD